jgi:predicted house-cleaning noncanonical NTP pyrophosphatase (MazG superfamily)
VQQLQSIQSVDDDVSIDLEELSHLETCPLHGLPFSYFDDSGNNEKGEGDQHDLQQVSYACERCISELASHSFAKIDQENLLNVHQLKQDIIKERQTCHSYLSKVVRAFNTRCSEIIPQAKVQELAQLRDLFSRMIRLLSSKQEELEALISQKYNRMAEKVKRKTTSVITKKQLIERNYHLLEAALKIVPLSILSCEESLLSGILLANSGLFDTVKEQMKEEKACKF